MKSMDTKTFTFTEDYKVEFEHFVESIIKDFAEIDVEDKKQVVESLTEQYFAYTLKMPEIQQLEKLSTFILRGQEDANPEYPFLSDRQLRRRHNDKEVVFYSPESRDNHMEVDGNSIKQAAPSMDSNESHKVKVRLQHDGGNMREFNGPLRKYFDENVTK